MNVIYRPPPDSDSDEDYEGFYFSNDLPKTKNTFEHVIDKETEFSNALSSGDIDNIVRLMRELNWRIEKLLHNNLTALQLTTIWGNVDAVIYLVNILHADVNFSKNSMPPLMLACQSTHASSEVLVQIVEFLIDNGATIHIKDMHRCTPLMAAAAQGHTHIVQYLLRYHGSYSLLEATDNNGETALYYAIQHNKPEIIKLLLARGAQWNIVNVKGYSPIQAAEFYGFNDLLNLLPKPVMIYTVPTQYAQYNILRDYIPQIFAKTDNAVYSQEVVAILRTSGKMGFLPYFSNANVSLESFLKLDDEDMMHLGLYAPIQRQIIKRVLLGYFLKHWEEEQNDAITNTNEGQEENNFHNILLMAASHLRQLVVIKCSLCYVRKNLQSNIFGSLPQKFVEDFQKTLNKHKTAIEENKDIIAYLNTFSPAQNPLYINYDNYIAAKRQNRRRSTVKHTALFVGISVIIYFKLRKCL